jgi:hypothetical protein
VSLAIVDQDPAVAHTYSRGAGIFTAAAEHWAIAVDPDQTYEWQMLLQAAYVLDDVLDGNEPQVAREQIYENYAAIMLSKQLPATYTTPAVLAKVRDLSNLWSQEKRERLADVILQIKDIASEKRETYSAKVLGQLALREGLETARFLAFDDDQTESTQRFNSWFEKLLQFGVVVDSSIDLAEDYTNGLTRIRPSRFNKATIAVSGVVSAARLLAITPLQLYRPLANAARALTDDTTKDTLRNSGR